MDSIAMTNMSFSSSPCGLSIGDKHQGGIIFYLDASGCHGLICAPTDHAANTFYNGSYTDTKVFSNCIGCGDGNTSRIVYDKGTGTYAAKICYDLTSGGYSDWHLPSKYKLNLMYENIGQGNNLGLGNIAGFYKLSYWSSTEHDANFAWYQYFSTGAYVNFYKCDINFVRAVRAF